MRGSMIFARLRLPLRTSHLNQRPEWAETIEVRAIGTLDPLYPAIRHSLLSLDPSLPITDIVPLSVEYESGLSREKLLAQLTGVFGVMALALAALGFYGLLSFNITRRIPEIGIRIAMGATRANIYALRLAPDTGDSRHRNHPWSGPDGSDGL